MNPSQTQNGGLTAAQQAAAAAARFAGYTQMYAQQQQQQPTVGRSPQFAQPYPAPSTSMRAPVGPPPPRPPFARPPPLPQHLSYSGAPGISAPPTMRPPPGIGPPPPRPQPTTATSSWQWSTGRSQVDTAAKPTTIASAPPVRFQITPPVRPGPPRPGFPTGSASSAFASPPGVAGAGNNTKWPDSLHDYVKRAFGRCKGAADQTLTQNALKELITNAIMSNNLWTRNWAAEPLPTLVGDVPVAQMRANNARPPPPLQQHHSQHSGPSIHMHKAPPGPPESFIAFNQPNTMKKGNVLKRKQQQEHSETTEDLMKKNQRRQRFHKDPGELSKYVTPTVDTKKLRVLTTDGELDLDAMVIKGTNQTIEKEYLRLTSAPHPSTVRPEPILKKALQMTKTKWKEGKCDYIYACSQLKSIRQDCTVQHIKNEFTVLVYETHARIALESGDINEFNQCQTQLHYLYEKLIPGQAIEFLSYRILYCLYISLQAKKADNGGQLGMYNVLAMVTNKVRQNDAVAHALAVREAVAMNDYHRFFKLYVDAPNMSGYLMDHIVPSIRLRALRAICKAYRPNIPLQFIKQELKLKGKEGKSFIKQCGIVFVNGDKGEKELVDTKNSDIVWALSDQSSLI